MLEFANIKPVTKASDVAAQGPKTAQAKSSREGPRQEFDEEYAATRQRERNADSAPSDRMSDRDTAAARDKTAATKPSEETSEGSAGKTAESDGTDDTAPATRAVQDEFADPGRTIAGGDDEAGASVEIGAQVAAEADPPDAGQAALPKTDTAATGTADAARLSEAAKGGEARKNSVPTTAETIFMSKAGGTAAVMPLEGDMSTPAPDQPGTIAGPEHLPTATATRPQPDVPKATAAAGVPTAQGLPQATEAQTKAASLREEAPLRELRHLSERNQPAQAPAAPQAAAPTQPSMTLAQAAMKQDTAREKLDLVALGAVDSEAWASPDTRSGQQTTAGGLSQLLARADTPAMIGRQMAEVLQRLPDRPVEIALNPKELGRVRMSISAAESGITVTVLAERPETLDLMRRNIDQLAREFQAIGYESINFAFSGGESRPEFSEGASEQSPAQISRLELTEAEDAPPVQDLSTAPTSGLDIRL